MCLLFGVNVREFVAFEVLLGLTEGERKQRKKRKKIGWKRWSVLSILNNFYNLHVNKIQNYYVKEHANIFLPSNWTWPDILCGLIHSFNHSRLTFSTWNGFNRFDLICRCCWCCSFVVVFWICICISSPSSPVGNKRHHQIEWREETRRPNSSTLLLQIAGYLCLWIGGIFKEKLFFVWEMFGWNGMGMDWLGVEEIEASCLITSSRW